MDYLSHKRPTVRFPTRRLNTLNFLRPLVLFAYAISQYVSHSQFCILVYEGAEGPRATFFSIGPSPASEVHFRRALRLYRRCRVSEENSSRWLEQNACRFRAERSNWTTFTILPSSSPARIFGHSHRRRSTVSMHCVLTTTSLVGTIFFIVVFEHNDILFVFMHWTHVLYIIDWWIFNLQTISKWMVLLVARENISRDRGEEDRWTSIWGSARTFTRWIGWNCSQINVECGFWPLHYNP